MYALKYPAFWLASGYAIAVLIIALSLLPALPGPDTAGFDKIAHGLMYATLAAWFCGIYRPAKWPVLLGVFVALGGLLELAQSMTMARSAEWQDMLANLVGLGVGLALGWTLLAGWCGWIERRLGLAAPGGEADT